MELRRRIANIEQDFLWYGRLVGMFINQRDFDTGLLGTSTGYLYGRDIIAADPT